MLLHLYKSLCHALRGCGIAVLRERNLKLFVAGCLLIVVTGFVLQITAQDWVVLGMAIGVFLGVEVCNTSIERLVDVVDDHFKAKHQTHDFHGFRDVKDIAAGAALIAALTCAFVTIMVFWPYVF